MRRINRPPPSTARRAFTLVESLIAAVILAIATIGLCGMMTASAAQTSGTSENAVSLQLARSLMEEILSKPFSPPAVAVTVVVGSPKPSRAFYDDAADYGGLVETSPIKDLSGNAVTLDVPGTFTRSVSYTSPYLPTSTPQPSAALSGVARIAITVRGPSGKLVTLSRIITNADVSK